LATEVREYFAYAINPTHHVKSAKSQPFSPILAASTLLHPALRSYVPQELAFVGKAEIALWISRLNVQDGSTTPPVTMQKYARLSQVSAANPIQSSNRFGSRLYLKFALF
jgi:hypothetical protein